MKLNYKLEGNGKTLVFIHGLSDNLDYWQPLTSLLKNHYQILRYDLRGHGLSEPGNENITMDTYVEDLHNLLNELELSEINLVGLSLGSAIALSFTIKHPDRVSSMVLMSSFYKCDKELTKVFNSFKRSLKKSFATFFDTILPMVLCPEVIEDNRELLNLIRDTSSTVNVESYIKAVDVCLEYDVENELKYVDVPTLILAGKYDEITSPDMQRQLSDRIRNSRLIVFNDVKHNLLAGENIVKISDIINKFLC